METIKIYHGKTHFSEYVKNDTGIYTANDVYYKYKKTKNETSEVFYNNGIPFKVVKEYSNGVTIHQFINEIEPKTYILDTYKLSFGRLLNYCRAKSKIPYIDTDIIFNSAPYSSNIAIIKSERYSEKSGYLSQKTEYNDKTVKVANYDENSKIVSIRTTEYSHISYWDISQKTSRKFVFNTEGKLDSMNLNTKEYFLEYKAETQTTKISVKQSSKKAEEVLTIPEFITDENIFAMYVFGQDQKTQQKLKKFDVRFHIPTLEEMSYL